MAVKPKLAASALFAFVLMRSSIAQQIGQTSPESAAASAFGHAVQAETGRNLKRIYKKRIQDLCSGDARRWGDGIVGYNRVTFANEQELGAKMLTLVPRWNTTGSQHPSFDASDFPRLRRYSVENCGVVGGQTKVVVVVAVYLSGWDTYWANWANLLGN
jgi:hypothetical protein